MTLIAMGNKSEYLSKTISDLEKKKDKMAPVAA